MSDPSETSGRPSASSIQQLEDNIPSVQQQQHRRTSHLSDEHIDTKPTPSRRRPGIKKETTLGSSNQSSHRDNSIMQRSISPTQMSPDSSVHYTRTGRISKAKKGLKVHHCDCGRSYTRAEHLRRHQRNHATNALQCEWPGCGKPFYRLDLLQRHQERHNEPGRGDSPQAYSPGSSVEPEPQVSAPVTLPAPIVTALPQSEPYYPQPASPMPVSAADPSHSKGASYTARHTPGPVPVPVDGIQNGMTWSDPFSHSPNYNSSSSEYASPIPSVPDYSTNMFANPPYGPGSNRTRTSSNASYIEPAWAYPSRSPTSATSTLAYTWNTNEKSPAPPNLGYMNTSYPMTSMPMSAGVDPMTGFGHYAPKTLLQRDEEEQAFLFPEQSYGMDLTHTYPFEQYLNNYWRYFHPAHPIVHRATAESINQSPMLRAAMIAIGGQYSSDASVKRKSRILHDRCMKLLDKREIDVMTEADRVCDLQALFLVEVLSQYRARRAAKALSSRFEALYQKLCASYQQVTQNIRDHVSALVQPENATYERWSQWIELCAQQRLLVCCYILEYQQAILLARNPQPSLINCSGHDLPLPTHSELWDATSPSDWAMAALQNPHQHTFVYEVSADSLQTFDTLQSSLVIAAYYNHFNKTIPYLALPNYSAIEHLLDNSSITQHHLLVAKLLQVVPIRALLAISGESWIFSEKVPSPQAFGSYRSTLRSWLNGLWSAGDGSQSRPAKDALKLAVDIAQHAMTAPANALRLELGADMGLYYAALTIWAITVAAHSRVNATQAVQSHRFQSHSPLSTARTNYPSASAHYSMNNRSATPNPSHPAAMGLTSHPASSPLPPVSSTGSMPYSELSMLSMDFLSNARVELDLVGIVSPWPRDMSQWQQGCSALMRWVKMRLRNDSPETRDSVVAPKLSMGIAGTGRGGDGFGELLDGVINVMEKIMSRGWDGWSI